MAQNMSLFRCMHCLGAMSARYYWPSRMEPGMCLRSEFQPQRPYLTPGLLCVNQELRPTSASTRCELAQTLHIECAVHPFFHCGELSKERRNVDHLQPQERLLV